MRMCINCFKHPAMLDDLMCPLCDPDRPKPKGLVLFNSGNGRFHDTTRSSDLYLNPMEIFVLVYKDNGMVQVPLSEILEAYKNTV